MQFHILPLRPSDSPPRPDLFPHTLLTPDTWDDYGYKTGFKCTLVISEGLQYDLGTVKILKLDQKGGPTLIAASTFTELPDDYCSLGTSRRYYDILLECGPAIYRPLLTGLRDAAYDPVRKSRFEDLQGFKLSLLRSANVERVLADATQLFLADTPTRDYDDGLKFAFKTSTRPDGTHSFVIPFDFSRTKTLPHRIVAIIGYNGTGKTRLLSNLAIAASSYGYENKTELLDRKYGHFVGTPPPFQTVIVVSYSAFDTFVLPAGSDAELTQSSMPRYIYCGLRERVTRPHEHDDRTDIDNFRLKSTLEIESAFLEALQRVQHQGRTDDLLRILRPFLQDASFRRIGLESLYSSFDGQALLEIFRQLSSGHKVALKILVQLVAFVEPKSTLVLIDEPESHLHPPLLAALLRCLRTCLEQLQAYCIIATHSPVVLQETPARYVRVLRRFLDSTEVAAPSIETFGENIGVITQEVFNLDDSATDWHRTLTTLATDLSLEEIDRAFDNRLGFTARSFIAALTTMQEG